MNDLNRYIVAVNMAAIMQWARAQGKHISIFVAKHDTEAGKRLLVEELCDVLRYGDDSQLPTPGLVFYAQGMPVVVTQNQLTRLKLVNGAPFKSVNIFPDLACGTIALASDVTLHLEDQGRVYAVIAGTEWGVLQVRFHSKLRGK